MPCDGICPSCGHLVIGEFAEETPEDLSGAGDLKSAVGFAKKSADAGRDPAGLHSSPPPSKAHGEMPKPVAADEHEQSPAAFGEGLLRSRDYSAQLLGVAIYSLLLHPTLGYLVFLAHQRDSSTVLTFACAYIPVAWLITRLLCTSDSETGGWRIKDPYLRAIFMKLNALWFGL
jgi:hypothetical protein